MGDGLPGGKPLSLGREIPPSSYSRFPRSYPGRPYKRFSTRCPKSAVPLQAAPDGADIAPGCGHTCFQPASHGRSAAFGRPAFPPFEGWRDSPAADFRAQLNTDIGCDGAENVDAAEEEFLLGVIEAHMPRRMPRRLHSL